MGGSNHLPWASSGISILGKSMHRVENLEIHPLKMGHQHLGLSLDPPASMCIHFEEHVKVPKDRNYASCVHWHISAPKHLYIIGTQYILIEKLIRVTKFKLHFNYQLSMYAVFSIIK